VTPRERAEALRALHGGPEPLVLANVWDVASAVVVAALPGCRAVATTSAGVANALGYPDGERVPAGEMFEVVARIARAVDVPVTADLEAGYGDAAATAEAAVEAGAAGLNLEDGNGPVAEHVERIRDVRAAGDRLGVPLVVNARVDAFLPGGSGDVGEAVERANAYLAAGADCAYPIAVADPDIVTRLVAGIRGPVNVHAAPGGPTVAELAGLGVRRISVGALLHRTSLAAARAAAAETYDAGTFGWAAGAVSGGELNERLA
jgi:2-methylisocitrate lyase-like PEP mutase family enzyme